MTKKKLGSKKQSSSFNAHLQKSTIDSKALPQDSLNHLAKVKWSSLQSDLLTALDTWNELNPDNKKSPEEEQLDKVKSLIEDLKLKLNDF